MKSCVARWFVIVVLGAACLMGLPSGASAQTNPAPTAKDLAMVEKEACIKNLKVIYDAIQAYQTDNKDLPNWLSDLVPQYLSDANVLICPTCRRTGRMDQLDLSDPKLASSYLFEFAPLPLGNVLPEAPSTTRREWKRRQMALAGAMVPIVRCRQHKPLLNLSFDGKVYESPVMWETVVSNRVNPADLTAPRLFRDKIATNAAAKASMKTPVAAAKPATQAPKAKPSLISLTKYFNATLTNTWLGTNAGDDLAALPTGRQKLGGVEFEVGGIVQLGSKSLADGNYPVGVKGIRVHRKCQHLYFLQAAGFGGAQEDGRKIGTYVVHYATNQMRLEIPIYYGNDVRDWHVLADEPAAPKELTVAWSGENEAGKQAGQPIRLFVTKWANLAPDVEIDKIDYTSNMAGPAPFLIGITAD
jgi:hypothetical protein